MAYLILENGKVFKGKAFGADREVVGEVVFTTAMTGYLETLTDPSYMGQIVLQTFPLIGNYGIIPEDFESTTVGVKAYIAKHPSKNPSNFRSQGDLDTFLKQNDIPGLYGIDTRELTKVIRDNGVMKGKITKEKPTDKDLTEVKGYSEISGAIKKASTSAVTTAGEGKLKVALLDFGAKNSITKSLIDRGCSVTSFPYNATADDILKVKPDGVILSNGPGDPSDKDNAEIVQTIKNLFEAGVPMMGIGMGHQLMAIAKGYETKKLKFGHRGSSQPIKDLKSGRVYTTSQNHGYVVEAKDSWLVNVNDKTCEGLEYGNSFSVQFYPGATGGPLDTEFLFDKFIINMEVQKNA